MLGPQGKGIPRVHSFRYHHFTDTAEHLARASHSVRCRRFEKNKDQIVVLLTGRSGSQEQLMRVLLEARQGTAPEGSDCLRRAQQREWEFKGT